MKRLLLALVVGLACAQAGWGRTKSPAPTTVGAAQDGVIAALAVSGDKAAIAWRFEHPIDSPLERIDAYLDGTLLPELSVQPYPGRGDTTAMVALFDRGGANGGGDVQAEKQAVNTLSAKLAPFHRLAIATYAANARILAPAQGRPEALAELFRAVTAVDEPSNLSQALMLAIGTVAQAPATRRAIFVFGDGHNDGVTPLREIEAMANASGVIVNFVLFPSQRTADAAALKALAANTGGLVIEPGAVATFLKAPFQALDSGGYRPVDLSGARRYLWQDLPTLKAVLRYGDRKIELVQSVEAPAASMGEEIARLAGDYRAWIAAAAVILAGAALVVLRIRRKPPNGGAEPVLQAAGDASLRDIDDGADYPLKDRRCTIGRSADNDIVIADDTVSRLHATIRDERGLLVIANASTNGTRVNHVAIDEAVLHDGDLVTIGPKTYHVVLRRNPAAASDSKSETAASAADA